MDRNDLLKWIRRDGSSIVHWFLPSGARAELEGVIRDGRHEVDADAFVIFMSIRALLREQGMTSCESDREAGHIMAMLNT
jgi:hypothetical protein